MRIQHNIMAMSAYRNYNTNTSALAKNLEKLSSGYKINRAGDDAAGLAISEKMRAQITGLNAAQKNVKDGISLVKTAEGAMQEIQDMLNRMDYLATQSANGTYQDEVDREALQKEVNQLLDEIDRIADSANFNGIKLLDGSLDKTSVSGVKYEKLSSKAIVDLLPDDMDGSGQITADAIGNKGILETDTSAPASKASFEVSLDGIGEVKVGAGQVFALKIGNSKVATDKVTADATFTGAQLAEKLNGKKLKVAGDGGTEIEYTITAKDGVLKFETDAEDVKLNTSAAVTWKVVNEDELDGLRDDGIAPLAEGDETGTITGDGSTKTGVGGTPGSKGTGKLAALTTASTTESTDADALDMLAVTIGGLKVKVASDKTEAADQNAAWVEAFNDAMGENATWTAAVDGNNIVITGPQKAYTEASSDSGKAAMLAEIQNKVSDFDATGFTVANGTDSSAAAKLTITAPTTASTTKASSKVEVSIGGKKYNVAGTNTTAADQAAAWAEAFKADATYSDKYTASAANGVVTIETKENSADTAPSGITFDTGAGKAWANGTADVGGQTVTLAAGSGLVAALDAAGASDGQVEVQYDSDNSKWIVSLGNSTSFEATATFDSATNKLTLKDANNNELLTLTADGTVTEANIQTAYAGSTKTVTGLTYAAPDGGDEELKTDVASGEILNTLTGIDWTDDADTSTIGTNADAIKGGKFTVTDANGNLEVDLADLEIADNDKVADVLAKMMEKVNTAIEAWNTANAETAGYKYGNARIVTGAGNTVVAPLAAGDGLKLLVDQQALDNDEPAAVGKEGTINTGIQNPVDYSAGSSAQLANAAVDFDEAGAWTDGSKITIGDTTYTVAVGKNSAFKNVANVVDLTDMETADAKTAAQRLSVAANGNSIFTVGHDGNGKTTLQQKTSAKDSTDMTTKEKFASYLGVSVADAASAKNAVAGKGLQLQIGDTSEEFNRLNVSVGDMHTSALGIADLNIGSAESAAKAIQTVKDAINNVSSVRGDLGAYQNRLEHTANNLSVMAENIQDAESSIRDTDIAEEMMAYTKNNILVQSAQAMLAQANQVPQGVLQLLG